VVGRPGIAGGPARLMLVSHGENLGGGGEALFDDLVRGLHVHLPAHPVMVVTPGEGEIAERARHNQANVRVIAQPRWADFRPTGVAYWANSLLLGAVTMWQSLGLIRAWKPDVVMSNTLTIPVAALAAKVCRVRHVWIVNELGRRDHDLSFVLGYRRTINLIGRLSDKVVCCSQAVSDELRVNGIPEAKLSVAHCGVDAPTDQAVNHRRPGGPLEALVVGRIAEPKGQLLAVQAVAAAVRAGADVRLRLVGSLHDPRYVAQVLALADETRLADRIELAGPAADPFPAYRRAHVFLMCSRDEAFGRVTVEAMKLGLPVVGVDTGGTTELVEDGRTGYLVPLGEAATMGEKLVALWADEDLRRRLAQQAQETASTRFAVARWVEQVAASTLGEA
jgi:glycosyltransferase involved in cell wall biosynthesis